MHLYRYLKQNHLFIVYAKLILACSIVGFLATFLAVTLKKITEYYEEFLLGKANSFGFYFLLLPLIGLTIIYFLRIYLFKNKENKGIKEIFECTQNKSKKMPLYKVPSHFINGFFTVIFGGSTGIEVSTVVASATIGSVAQQKNIFLRKYKDELISAGIAAGITALFLSPMAGLLFSLEVIFKKVSRRILFCTIISVAVSMLLVSLLGESHLFLIQKLAWHYHAIPYFILLGVLSGVNSVYLTKSVIFFKHKFNKINRNTIKIFLGAIVIGVLVFLYPVLYGDGYHGIATLLKHPHSAISFAFFFSVFGIVLLKPIITAVTLAAGGDGGVFAPSLVIGAFLGFFVVTLLNNFFDANLYAINFIIIGMAAMLSASIHAPLTSLFLVCAVVDDYTLFIPILIACLVSKYTAKQLYPYTVYSLTKFATN